jgi:hypothetical protein
MKDIFSASNLSTPARAIDNGDDNNMSRGFITPDESRVLGENRKLPPRSPPPYYP